MSKNKKLSKAVRARMRRTGESYSTARMHLLADSPKKNLYDYVCTGPDGSRTGKVVPTSFRLPEPVLCCRCGHFAPISMVNDRRCDGLDCGAEMYVWLHPDRVLVRPWDHLNPPYESMPGAA